MMSYVGDSNTTGETETLLEPNNPDEMTGISKEVSNASDEKKGPKAAGLLDEGIISSLYSFAKKAATVGLIYFFGYMGWSVAWILGPLVLSVAREQWRKESELKRNIAKASAMANEKDVILARIDELPAWVFFPDVERCEWLNRILNQVWPNANHFAKNLIKDSIEPSVRKALTGYKLNGFKFDRMILGTIPPRVGGIKVYDKNVARNEIIMDIDLFYAGDCDINFILGGIRGGIKDFQIHGTVRVIMKPLIASMPLIGGLQIFFLNNPNVDFNLVGVADLLDMPGLSDILRKIVVDVIASIMVLPNKLPIILSNEVPALSLKMPEPEGVLRIHVVEAKDLMKKDISVLGKGKSDPYAVIQVGAQQFRTQTIDNTVNPKWDYWCEANVYAESGQTVHFTLYDKDDAKDDELLGRATVEISSVTKKGHVDTWLTLEQAKHGLVHIRLTWLSLSADKKDLEAALKETQLLRVTSMSSALLTVFVDSGKNLPQARPTSQPDPYMILSVGKKNEQTSVQMRTNAPVWEQGFTFLVGNPDNDTLQLKILDQKTGTEIGKLVYLLSALMEKKNLEIMSQPFQLQKSGAESKVLMSMSLRVLKRVESEVEEADNVTSSDEKIEDTKLSRAASVRSNKSVEVAAHSTSVSAAPPVTKKQEPKVSSTSGLIEQMSVHEEPFIMNTINTVLMASPPRSPNLSESDSSNIIKRSPSVTSSAGAYGLGKILLTVNYSVQRQKLTVIVHKIKNIPLKDPANIPDPYVKLYLLPGRSKDSKRKTNVVKDNCDPEYEVTFEYVISSAEINCSELEITVCTQKGFLSGGSPVIGMQRIDLSETDVKTGVKEWYDLLPESKFE